LARLAFYSRFVRRANPIVAYTIYKVMHAAFQHQKI
jgi:hypothetical protein